MVRTGTRGHADPLVNGLQEVFQDTLDFNCLPAPETNFFNLGCSSMRASHLVSKIRKIYNVPFSHVYVSHHPVCASIADLIRERGGKMCSVGLFSKDKASLAEIPLATLCDTPYIDDYSVFLLFQSLLHVLRKVSNKNNMLLKFVITSFLFHLCGQWEPHLCLWQPNGNLLANTRPAAILTGEATTSSGGLWN
jgi:hypothetical protein